MGSRLIQTEEKYEAIFQRYIKLNKQLIEEHGAKIAEDLTHTYKYKILADEFFMEHLSIGRIIRKKLKEPRRIIIRAEPNNDQDL